MRWKDHGLHLTALADAWPSKGPHAHAAWQMCFKAYSTDNGIAQFKQSTFFSWNLTIAWEHLVFTVIMKGVSSST